MIANLAQKVLDVINDVYANDPDSTPLPKKQFIAAGGRGTAVHEGEQLSISLEQVYSGLPGDQAQEPATCDTPQSAVFGVELVRCVPTQPESRSTKVPKISADQLTDIALIQMKDAELLIEAGLTVAKMTWAQGGMADVTAGSPLGGVQPMILSLVLAIGDDFPETYDYTSYEV